MPWKLRLLKEKPEDGARVGDCWYMSKDVWEAAQQKGFTEGGMLGRNYFEHHVKLRAPIMVVMPDGYWFCVDSKATEGHDNGWTVTGELPNITVAPSIQLGSIYHGWIKNGEITNDVDGRKFNQDGFSK